MSEEFEVTVECKSLKEVLNLLNQSLANDEGTVLELCNHMARKLRVQYKLLDVKNVNSDYLIFKYDRTIRGFDHKNRSIGVFNIPRIEG